MKPKRTPPQPRLPVLSRMEPARRPRASWAERFENSFVIQVLRALGSVTIIFAFVGFLFTLIDRPQKQAIDAWAILLSDRPGNTGKSDALSTLVDLDQSIRSVVVRRLSDDGGALRDKYCFIEPPAGDTKLDMPAITKFEGDLLYLRGVELRGADARGFNAEAADFTDGDFRNAQLQNASFFNSDLTNVDFSGAQFYRTCLAATELAGANFDSAKLIGTTLYFAGSHAPPEDGKRISEPAKFTKAEIVDTDLRLYGNGKVDFSGSCIDKSEIAVSTSARFDNAVLTDSRVLLRDNATTFGDLENLYIDESFISQVDTTENWLSAPDFEALDKSANLSNISLSKSILLRMTLAGWKFQNVDLSKARFTEVDFIGAAFDGVEISGVNFQAPVSHYARTCAGEEVRGPFFPEVEPARNLVARLAGEKPEPGDDDPVDAGTTSPSPEQLAGMWAWADDPPSGLRKGTHVGHLCPASLRRNYLERQRFGLPLGCE